MYHENHLAYIPKAHVSGQLTKAISGVWQELFMLQSMRRDVQQLAVADDWFAFADSVLESKIKERYDALHAIGSTHSEFE